MWHSPAQSCPRSELWTVKRATGVRGRRQRLCADICWPSAKRQETTLTMSGLLFSSAHDENNSSICLEDLTAELVKRCRLAPGHRRWKVTDSRESCYAGKGVFTPQKLLGSFYNYSSNYHLSVCSYCSYCRKHFNSRSTFLPRGEITRQCQKTL